MASREIGTGKYQSSVGTWALAPPLLSSGQLTMVFTSFGETRGFLSLMLCIAAAIAVNVAPKSIPMTAFRGTMGGGGGVGEGDGVADRSTKEVLSSGSSVYRGGIKGLALKEGLDTDGPGSLPTIR